MRARDIMSRPVVSVDTYSTVRDAVTALTEHGFAAVPVVDNGDRVVGIFSETDGLRADTRPEEPVTIAMTTPALAGRGTAGCRRGRCACLVSRKAPVVPVLAEEALNASLLVLGTRGRGGFPGLLLGSTGQHLLYHAPCPVAIVRTEPDR